MERKRSEQESPRSERRRPTGAAVPQARVTDALTRALFAEWAATGYAALSLERVARRAGVGKAALYRRWPSKVVMVSDALTQVGLTITEVPDTGSLLGDVRAVLLSIRRVLRHPLVRRIILDLHAEVGRSPELEASIRPFQAARRERSQALIDRAVARGELHPAVDREIASDLIGAAPYWRIAVIGGRADRAYVDRLTVMLCAALKADMQEGTTAATEKISVG